MADAHESREPVSVEELRAEQVDEVVLLFDAYRQFYHQPSDVAAATAYLRARLERGESRLLVARLPLDTVTSLVGFVQLYPSFSSIALTPIWVLNDLYVSASARRHGAARALLRACRALGERTGASELTLQTAVDNLPAQALYTSEGWHRDDVYLSYILTLSLP